MRSTVDQVDQDEADPAPAPTGAGGTAPLSQALREATALQHTRAERTTFLEALLAGSLDVSAYADLAVQHHTIYRALEDAAEVVRRTPYGEDLVDDALTRLPALEADLDVLIGASWRSTARVLPAAERYAAHLADRAVTPAGYTGHAYTRYLGDLSGGQAIRAVLQRAYGLPDDAVQFYTFPAIPKLKPYKDAYRSRLDGLAFCADERAEALREACEAFDLTTGLALELGDAHPLGS